MTARHICPLFHISLVQYLLENYLKIIGENINIFLYKSFVICSNSERILDIFNNYIDFNVMNAAPYADHCCLSDRTHPKGNNATLMGLCVPSYKAWFTGERRFPTFLELKAV